MHSDYNDNPNYNLHTSKVKVNNEIGNLHIRLNRSITCYFETKGLVFEEGYIAQGYSVCFVVEFLGLDSLHLQHCIRYNGNIKLAKNVKNGVVYPPS